MIRYQNELDPDGVRIIVPWQHLDVGSSVFIPCINADKCRSQIARITNEMGIEVQTRHAVQNQHLGLRLWRTA